MLCRLGKVNYEVYMPDKRKRRTVFHVNMLKKWHPPEATSIILEAVFCINTALSRCKCSNTIIIASTSMLNICKSDGIDSVLGTTIHD